MDFLPDNIFPKDYNDLVGSDKVDFLHNGMGLKAYCEFLQRDLAFLPKDMLSRIKMNSYGFCTQLFGF